MFVKELEITLENGMKISGELDLPERQGQWKTIILFHGSGPSDRHATVESMGGIVSRNFDLLSEGFVKARYAVFRYDKRENYDIEIIIRDAREVTRFVSGLSEVEGILFYGWSEGVRVCTTLVSDFPNAQALILQSGIAEGWSSYFSYILRELTVEKLKELDNNSDSILEISDFLNCIPDSTSISFSLYLLILGTDKEGNMKFNEELDPEGKGRFSIIDNWIPLADEIVADPTTLIRFAENAPGETWAGILDDIKKIQLPILVLHGLNDGWISPVEAVQIAKAARNNADIILFKGLGHSLSKVKATLISQKKEYVELAKSIKKIVCSISGNDYIDYEDNLLENGLDSLLLSQISGRIVSDIQEAQGMRFDEILRASLTMPTIMGIAQYISDCKNPSKNQMHSNAGNQTRNSYTVVYIFGDNENEIRDVLIEKLSASNISCKRVGGQEIIERCHEDISVKKKYIIAFSEMASLCITKASELLGENIIINRIFLINPSKAKESDLYLGDISIIDGNSVAIKSWEKAVLGNVREFESNSNDIFDIIMRELENDK